MMERKVWFESWDHMLSKSTGRILVCLREEGEMPDWLAKQN